MQVTVSRIKDGKVELTQTGRDRVDDDEDEEEDPEPQEKKDPFDELPPFEVPKGKRGSLGAVLGVLGFAPTIKDLPKVSY